MGRPRIHLNNAARQRAFQAKRKREAQPYYAKRAAARDALDDLAALEHKALEGVYDVVIVDPPWPVAFQAREARPNQASLAYTTMPLADIRALRLPLADAAHVWLWTTQRFLPEAFGCLDVWGLTYSCCFVWHKPGGMQPLGLPQMNCEFALYGRKGPAVFLDTAAFATSFTAPREAHSAKPEVFYDVVRRVTAGRRLDMFARRHIPGFESWGYEAPAAAVLREG
jgi:N6-adenosine-specific RNA methylase IME4